MTETDGDTKSIANAAQRGEKTQAEPKRKNKAGQAVEKMMLELSILYFSAFNWACGAGGHQSLRSSPLVLP